MLTPRDAQSRGRSTLAVSRLLRIWMIQKRSSAQVSFLSSNVHKDPGSLDIEKMQHHSLFHRPWWQTSSKIQRMSHHCWVQKTESKHVAIYSHVSLPAMITVSLLVNALWRWWKSALKKGPNISRHRNFKKWVTSKCGFESPPQ